MDPEFIGSELKTNLSSVFNTEMLAFSQISKLHPINADLDRAVLDLLNARIMKHAGDFSIVIGGFTSGHEI